MAASDTSWPTVPAPALDQHDDATLRSMADAFADDMHRRRTVRDYADRDVPREVIEACVRAAGTAPSGANCQPWHFVLIPRGPVRTVIREAAEKEEREFYEHRASQEWLDALAPLGTDTSKPFLEEAPWLIAVFLERNRVGDDGKRIKNYYMPESVGIATGILITALHRLGLATLTHTPSPMKFLNEILGRPTNEKPFLLLVTGYAADDAQVPDIQRKLPGEISTLVSS